MSHTRKTDKKESHQNNQAANPTDTKNTNNTTTNTTINTTTNTTANSSALTKNKFSEGFTAKDYEFLCENENYRYMRNNKSTVGHAVITKNENGEEIALQYAIPSMENGKA